MEKTLEQQPADCLKIVLFGSESTGKTTMAKALAAHYNTHWVPEFAREYLQKKYDDAGTICEESDLIPIAKGQMALENKLSKTANGVLFCDTNVLQTYTYGQVYYDDFENEHLKAYLCQHHYHAYLLTDIDIPWEEDDLRDKPHDREAMHQHFKQTLLSRNLTFIELQGNFEQRLKKAIRYVDDLMTQNT